jgi:uncharacterized protein YjgD (DUF1641 family)
MAKPTELIPKATEAKDELRRRLEAAPEEHAAALLSAWDLLERLHEAQLLELAKGLASSSSEIIGSLSEALNTRGSITAMRNGLMLVELLGAMQPEALHPIVAAMANGVAASQGAAAKKAPSLWEIFKTVRGENARRALGMMVAGLDGVGRAMAPDPVSGQESEKREKKLERDKS